MRRRSCSPRQHSGCRKRNKKNLTLLSGWYGDTHGFAKKTNTNSSFGSDDPSCPANPTAEGLPEARSPHAPHVCHLHLATPVTPDEEPWGWSVLCKLTPFWGGCDLPQNQRGEETDGGGGQKESGPPRTGRHAVTRVSGLDAYLTPADGQVGWGGRGVRKSPACQTETCKNAGGS